MKNKNKNMLFKLHLGLGGILASVAFVGILAFGVSKAEEINSITGGRTTGGITTGTTSNITRNTTGGTTNTATTCPADQHLEPNNLSDLTKGFHCAPNLVKMEESLKCQLDESGDRDMPAKFKDPATGIEKQMTCDDWISLYEYEEEEKKRAKLIDNSASTSTNTSASSQNHSTLQLKENLYSFSCGLFDDNPFCRRGTLEAQGLNLFQEKLKDAVSNSQNSDNADTNNKQTNIKKAQLEKEISKLQAEAVLKNKTDPSVCSAPPPQIRPRECDIIYLEEQLKELTLKAGVSCPATAQLQSLIEGIKQIFEEIRALDPTKTTIEQFLEVSAKFDNLHGDGQDKPNIFEELLGNHGGESSASSQKPGVLSAAEACKQIGFIQRDAERELSNYPNLADTPIYKALDRFSKNPLAYLPEDVDIFALWQPDPAECGDGVSSLVNGGSRISDFGAATALSENNGNNENGQETIIEENGEKIFEFMEELEETPQSGMGPVCSFYEPPLETLKKPECMPPIERYLGMPYGIMRDVKRTLDQQNCELEYQKYGQIACENFNKEADALNRDGKYLPDEPPGQGIRTKVKKLLDEGIQFCKDDDYKAANEKFGEYTLLTAPFSQAAKKIAPPARKAALEDIENTIKQENLETDAADKVRAELSKIETVAAAADQQYRTLVAKTVRFETLVSETHAPIKTTLFTAKQQIAQIMENPNSATLGRALAERYQKIISLANSAAENLPDEGRKSVAVIVDASFAGVSSRAAMEIMKELDGLLSSAKTGVLKDEEKIALAKKSEETVMKLLNSPEEMLARRAENVKPFDDTSIKEWHGSWLIIAVLENLASTKNAKVGVARLETYNQAVTRAVRLAQTANPEKFSGLDVENPAAIKLIKERHGTTGDNSWSRPFWLACQKANVANCLKPPVASGTDPINRQQMASLVINVLKAAGVSLPKDTTIAAPTDVDPEYAEAVKTAKAIGIMGGCTGPDDPMFCGRQKLNVAMDIVIAVRTANYIKAWKAAQKD